MLLASIPQTQKNSYILQYPHETKRNIISDSQNASSSASPVFWQNFEKLRVRSFGETSSPVFWQNFEKLRVRSFGETSSPVFWQNFEKLRVRPFGGITSPVFWRNYESSLLARSHQPTFIKFF